MIITDRSAKNIPKYDIMIEWAKTFDPIYLRPEIVVLARVLPLVTFILAVLSFWKGLAPVSVPFAGLLLQTAVLYAVTRRNKALDEVYAYKDSIGVYGTMLERFEKDIFQTEYLQYLQKNIYSPDGKTAWTQIKELSGIAERIADRSNAMFLIVNIFTLWDIHCLIALENWKKKSGRYLERWVDAVAELEALGSLAGIYFEHPDWVMPELSAEEPVVQAVQTGHPLLQNPVCNDVVLDRQAGVLLITGSNMSGKSTLLRTMGVNLVLAYVGAPVHARSFRCSLLHIYSCMRVRDDLVEGLSSFYAELLRIKMIVEASKTEKNVFFLLDEIFKGTNSEDRHAGAKVVIKQLAQAGAMGLVSTHDLELGALERESGQRIKNYHFREFYENEEIRFDYQLKPGISTTRNAMYLIRLAGIEAEKE